MILYKKIKEATMKKVTTLVAFFLLVFALVGCNGNILQTTDQQEGQTTADSAEGSVIVESLEAKISDIESQLKSAQKEYDTLESNYENYVDKMKPYEDLEAAEAEVRQIEADRILQEESEAELDRLEEEERLRAEKEAQGYETGITYEQLARNPDDYVTEKVKLTGKVIQVIEDQSSSEIQMRLAVNGDYDSIIYVGYDKSIVSQRVLDDDNITIYGSSIGTITYQSTMGGDITIPAVYVDRIDFN